MHIPDIDPEKFIYPLPEERIARYPLPRRDEARLLVYRKGHITTYIFRDLPQLLAPEDLLILNNTKVIRARLFFRKPTGAQIEIFCLEPSAPASYEEVFASTEPVVWECLVGNIKKWKEGALAATIPADEGPLHLTASRLRREGNKVWIRFAWDHPGISFGQLLDAAGRIPIPPYLKRESEPSDITDYQTVYAVREGSVAAPTAGLHFTPEMLEQLRREKRLAEVTLHVGAGTFRPIQTSDIREHNMHTEHYSVDRSLLERLATRGKRLIAVGTTSVRTLESLYWLAVKISREGAGRPVSLHTGQWDPYQPGARPDTHEAVAILVDYMDKHKLQTLQASTQLMIVPGYRFRYVEGMITNFHLPKSTLLLLIAAFTGDDWKKIYDYALTNDYRFLSYGDASLLLP